MIQTRIKQRFDTLENWIQNNTVLLPGELAVVDCGQQTRFKVGDGTKSFTQLPFIDQNQLCTRWIVADAMSQGRHSSSAPGGFAAGFYLCANANFSQALGFNAETISSDTYSFVWNGNDTSAIGDYYSSHGKGTFSINPLSGLSGVYIGEDTLASILESNDAVPAIFKTVQMVKPWSAGERLHARMTIARDDQFEDVIAQSIDTAVNGNCNFLKAFTNDGVSSSQWTTMPSNGFYTDANDVPVIFALHEALSALGETPTISSEYYIKYYWYFNDGRVEHRFDEFSIAVPTNTTAGANPGDVIHRDEFYEVRQDVIPLKKTIGLDENYQRYYIGQTGIVADIEDELTGTARFLLEDYQFGSTYRFKFSTGISACTAEFYVDNGNGPEKDTSLQINIDTYTFLPDTSYQIEVQGDVVRVHPLGYSSSSGGGGGGGGSGPYRYPLIVASPVSSDASSLTYVIQDHAVTTIEISSASKAVKVKLPEKQGDGARDFIIRVEISSSTAPDFSFLGVDETLTFDSDNEDWYILEPGLNLVSFTETRA